MAAIVSYGTMKIAILTANDEWGDLHYAIKNMNIFKRSKEREKEREKGEEREKERKTRVVVLGTGWGALSFIQKMDENKVDLTVISPRSFFFYTPLLAGTATGTVRTFFFLSFSLSLFLSFFFTI